MAWPRGRSLDGGVDEIPLPSGCAGRLFLCGKHAVGPDPDALLARVGATTVVCLNDVSELEARYPSYVRWLASHAGTRAVHHPIHDFHAPALPEFTRLIDTLVERLHAGEHLVVTCGAGIGRSGTVAVGVLVRMGVPLYDALAIVRTHRPMAGPEVGVQMDVLEQFATAQNF